MKTYSWPMAHITGNVHVFDGSTWAWLNEKVQGGPYIPALSQETGPESHKPHKILRAIRVCWQSERLRSLHAFVDGDNHNSLWLR